MNQSLRKNYSPPLGGRTNQYTPKDFLEFCEISKITQSMNKIEYPYNNTPMEWYFNTLKNELIYLYDYQTEDKPKTAIEKFAYVTYDHVRPHSSFTTIVYSFIKILSTTFFSLL